MLRPVTPEPGGEPFWTRPALPGLAARPPAEVDVLIVGAGITGAAVLALLATAGRSVACVDADRVAGGASGRNAGFLLTGVADCYATAVDTLGHDVAAAAWRFTAESHDVLLRLAGGRLPGHHRDGAWTLAVDEAEATALRRSAMLLAEDGMEGDWIPRPQGVAPGHLGGLLMPRDGVLDPAATVAALVAPHAARVCEGVGVEEVRPCGDAVDVRTTAGDVRARAVVVAVNAWTARLLPAVPVRPVRAQMLATEPFALTGDGRPAYADRGHRYWRRGPRGEILVGGWRNLAVAEEVGFDAVPTAAVQRHLDSHVHVLGAGGARVSHRWAGIMGFTPDGLPCLGALPEMPGVVVCGGYTGHGMGFAARAAEHVVAVLEGAEPPWWLRPDRFGGATAAASPPAG